jgi:SAM-dependent MidA family methyltransferase
MSRIRTEIGRAGGAIGFDRFMELALYSPGLGYYSAPAERFGEGGDFVTAPEISPLFGRCLAHPIAEVLEYLETSEILEVGAGSGKLAADLLARLAIAGRLPERYLILELGGELRARQEATLRERVPELLPRVAWLDGLPARGFRGIVLANELLDALPVVRFIVQDNSVSELHVGAAPSGLEWRVAPARRAVSERVEALRLPAAYVSEVNLAAEAWVRSIAECLDHGLLLLTDYGFPRHEYYHPERANGTLVCHYRHRVHDDPLTRVGLQDITAHVDFTAIAEAGRASGLSVVGYASQAAFLLGSGLDRLLADSDPSDARAHLMLTQEVKKLTMPSEMGELFKVIGLARGAVPALAGFGFQDRRGRL